MTDIIIPHEHLVKETVLEADYYPDHAPRGESPTFRHTKEQGHKAGLRCAISGQPAPEYHHVWCEWAYADAVDWTLVKAIATGEVTELAVLDPLTDQPTAATFPVQESFIWAICRLAAVRGFDWAAFDPTAPATFVDSLANMLPISAKFHRAPTHGIHHKTFPAWAFQAFPRRPGFVFTADELPAATLILPPQA